MDDAGFRALFEGHFDSVWRFARRRTGSSSDADDVTADIFAVAWRRRQDLPDGDDAPLWLFGAARKVLANHHRGNRRRTNLEYRLQGAVHPGSDRSVDPADLTTGRKGDAVWRALAQLKNDDRDLLLMRAWDELAVTEMAIILDCTPNAVSVRLHKARRRLAEALTEMRADAAVEHDGSTARSESAVTDPKTSQTDAVSQTDAGGTRTGVERTTNTEGERQ